MSSRLDRGLMLGALSSAAFWGLAVLGDVRISFIHATSLPEFSQVRNAVDERGGEKLLDTVKKEVDERFAKEKEAAQGKYGSLVNGQADAAAIVSAARKKADVYANEYVEQARAALTTQYLQKGYEDLRAEHTKKIEDSTGVQKKINDLQQKLNMYDKIYVKVKFLLNKG